MSMIVDLWQAVTAMPDMEGRLYLGFLALFLSCVLSLIVGAIKPGFRSAFEGGFATLFEPFLMRLNRAGRGHTALSIRGGIALLIWCVLIVLIILPIHYAFILLGQGVVFQLVMLALLMAPFSALFWLRKLPKKRGEGLYRPLALAANASLIGVDEEGVNRIAVSEAMHSLLTRLALPLVGFLVGGLYLAVFLSGLAVMVRLSLGGGHGMAFTRLPRLLIAPFAVAGNVMLLPPMVLAGFLTPGTRFKGVFALPQGVGLMVKDHFPAFLSAHILGFVLGGPVAGRNGERVSEGWLGPKSGTAKLQKQDVARAAYYMALCVIMLLGSLFLVLSWTPEALTDYIPAAAPLPDPILVPDPDAPPAEGGLPPLAPAAPAE